MLLVVQAALVLSALVNATSFTEVITDHKS